MNSVIEFRGLLNHVDVDIAIGNNPNGGTLSLSDLGGRGTGVASFHGRINRGGHGYTLIASSPGLTEAVSAPFDIFGPTKLAFISQPSSARVNEIFNCSVEVQDENGNRVTNPSYDVEIAIGNNPNGGTLTITSALGRTFNGVAGFGSRIDRSGDGYTLVVTSPGLTPAVSTPFTIIPNVNPPIAVNDAATVAEDSSANIIQVVANDTDTDGDALFVPAVAQGAHGSVSLGGNVVFYTPDPNYFGQDSFTYTVSDGRGNSATGTVTVTVSPVNDVPIATSDIYRTSSLTPLIVNGPGVLANDLDVDGDPLTAVLMTSASHGSLSFSSNGGFMYTPDPSFEGTDTFSYATLDGATGSNVATVQITVIGKIFFTSTRDGNLEIYSMNTDGTGQTRLTNNLAVDIAPARSPNGQRIAFTSNRAGNFEVYVMNPDGSSPVRLTTNARVDGAPAWSPDGSKIAFTSNRDGNFEIYVMNANGTGLTRLTNNSAADIKPSWSPDGSKLVFSSNRQSSLEIYTMNANGSAVSRLTNNSAADLAPAWSADGTKITFTSDRNGNLEIYVMNVNGSGQTRLTNHAATDAEPAWSSNGKIVFSSRRDGNFEIYSMNANGAGLLRLTNNSAADTSPD